MIDFDRVFLTFFVAFHGDLSFFWFSKKKGLIRYFCLKDWFGLFFCFKVGFEGFQGVYRVCFLLFFKCKLLLVMKRPFLATSKGQPSLGLLKKPWKSQPKTLRRPIEINPWQKPAKSACTSKDLNRSGVIPVSVFAGGEARGWGGECEEKEREISMVFRRFYGFYGTKTVVLTFQKL